MFNEGTFPRTISRISYWASKSTIQKFPLRFPPIIYFVHFIQNTRSIGSIFPLLLLFLILPRFSGQIPQFLPFLFLLTLLHRLWCFAWECVCAAIVYKFSDEPTVKNAIQISTDSKTKIDALFFLFCLQLKKFHINFMQMQGITICASIIGTRNFHSILWTLQFYVD